MLIYSNLYSVLLPFKASRDIKIQLGSRTVSNVTVHRVIKNFQIPKTYSDIKMEIEKGN